MSAERKFLERLSVADRYWLENLWQQAQQVPPSQWVQWLLCGDGRSIHLGWMAPSRADWLRAYLRPLPSYFSGQLLWPAAKAMQAERSQWLKEVLSIAYEQNLISGWRHELYAWWSQPTIPPEPEHPPALLAERAGFRHLGLLSHAVHVHGFLPDGDLWCGRRSLGKATDPGLLDNLAAGGMSAGETPIQAVVRELQEEAGLKVAFSRLTYRGSVRTCRVEQQGWHDERLLVYSFTLKEDEYPKNLDGEVQDFECLTPTEWVARLRLGLFTADAAAALVCGLGLTPPSIR